jgi:hypothetical protein
VYKPYRVEWLGYIWVVELLSPTCQVWVWEDI